MKVTLEFVAFTVDGVDVCARKSNVNGNNVDVDADHDIVDNILN